MDNKFFTNFDSTFFEKTRLSILTIIYSEDDVSFNRLKEVLKIPDGTLYSHLKKLIEANYILAKKIVKNNNVNTIYKMTKSGKKQFANYLKFLENFLNNYKKNDV